MNLLIVEDDLIIRKSIVNHLKGFYSIYESSNAHEAVEVIKNNNIDLITTDMKMNKINGFGTGADLINYIEDNKINIPIIIITAYNELIEIYNGYTCVKAISKKPIYLTKLKVLIDETYQNHISMCVTCNTKKARELLDQANRKANEFIGLLQ